MLTKLHKCWNIIGCLVFLLCLRSLSWAQFNMEQYDSFEGAPGSAKGHVYELITGGFGALLIIICALGGFVMLIMTRQGRAGKNAPILGGLLLFIAVVVFAYRVMIKSGFLGHEYLQW